MSWDRAGMENKRCEHSRARAGLSTIIHSQLEEEGKGGGNAVTNSAQFTFEW